MAIPSEFASRSQHISTRNNNKDDIAFQVISWYATDADLDGDSGDTAEDTPISANEPSNKSYVIKMFGVTDEGATISVSVTNFCPFFWIKLTPSTNPQRIDNDIRYHLGLKGYRDHYAGHKLIQRKDVWGFTNFKEFPFMKLFFKSRGAARAAQYYLGRSFKLYECNIEPFLRFIHTKDIQPCGWVTLPAGKYRDTFVLPTNCQYDVEIPANSIGIFEDDVSAKFLIASFDIECMSDTGDFPVAIKTYKRVAADLYDLYQEHKEKTPADVHNILLTSLSERLTHKPDPSPFNTMADIEFKDHNSTIPSQTFLAGGMDDMFVVLNNPNLKREDVISKLDDILTRSLRLPPLAGDKVIQIGTTFHYYGDRNLAYRHIITLGTCDPISSHDIPTTVEPCESETGLLLAWQKLASTTNPDILTGYNIFGFDMQYLYQRAQDLQIERSFMMLSRFTGFPAKFEKTRLSSSALGDNDLNYIDMYGRVSIDMMKVIQRDHKLDSFKLDNVAHHFLKSRKNDVSPNDIFRLQRQGAAERKTIAEYCLQDCALCNHLMIKLEIIANNMGMSNVCLVPLTYIFMRGQGIKIFSLVLKQCADDGFVMPVVRKPYGEDNAEDEEGYEGAIVLEPETGIYLDTPISVLDYASLYPSSMISENISHDCYVMDERYANLPGVNYLDITFDLADGKKQVCRFAQNQQGLIPRILQKLLKARKTTRLKMEWDEVSDGTKTYTGMVSATADSITITSPDGTKTTLPSSPTITRMPLFNSFQKAVLDGLQLAYKITANSLYGQIGARTSPIYLKELAACTTAVGRSMIMKAKAFIETNYSDAQIIYGDTDSVFVKFSTVDSTTGEQLKGLAARERAWELAEEASSRFKKTIKPPHNLEVDKVFHPFILLSKKRYVGNKYEGDMNKFKQTSMGIVLKRRDNANIVKKVYGGVIDIILNKEDIKGSIDFLKQQLEDLIAGKTSLDELVITKSLRADYKDPTRIAHKVLSERIGERDPGNKPQVNDRIPYVYIQELEVFHPETGKPRKVLQGERIETPAYITANNLKPDYGFYITNQIMKPVLQLYAIIADKIGLRSQTQYQQAYQEFLDGGVDKEKAADKLMALKEKDVKQLLFDPFLNIINPPKPKKTKSTAPPKLSTAGIPTTIIDGVEVTELPKPRARRKTTKAADTTPIPTPTPTPTEAPPPTKPAPKTRTRVVKTEKARIEIPV